MANILDTFFFIFDADAKKLDAGLDKADKSTKELEKDLQKADKAGQKMGEALGGALGKIAGALAGFLAIRALKDEVLEVADAMDTLGDAADALNIPVEKLSAWSMAVTVSDGTQEGFISSLNSLNTGMNLIATVGKGRLLPFFTEMGLSMADIKEGAKDPISALEKMADKFHDLTKAQAAGIGSKLGLDQGTINLLSQGRRGVDELIARQKELGVQTQAQSDAAGKFDNTMKEWNATFTDLKRQIVGAILPALTWFIEKVRDIVAWMTSHKALVITFFSALAVVMTAVFLPAIIAVTAALWTMITPLLIAALPFIAITAIVVAFAAALGLAVDDLWAFMHGNESVIGELVKKWPMLGEAIHGIGDVLVALIEIVRSFATFFFQLFTEGPEAALKNLRESMGSLVAFLSEKFPAIADIFAGVAAVIVTQAQAIGDTFSWLTGLISKGIDLLVKSAGVMRNLAAVASMIPGFQFAAPLLRTGAAAGRAASEEPPSSSPAVAGAPRAGAGALAGSAGATSTLPAYLVRPASPVASPEAAGTREAVAAGREQLAATRTPIAAQTSNSITNRREATVNKTTQVTVEKIDVHTQATDGAQVASAIGDSLQNHMRNAIDQNDDGVAA